MDSIKSSKFTLPQVEREFLFDLRLRRRETPQHASLSDSVLFYFFLCTGNEKGEAYKSGISVKRMFKRLPDQ